VTVSRSECQSISLSPTANTNIDSGVQFLQKCSSSGSPLARAVVERSVENQLEAALRESSKLKKFTELCLGSILERLFKVEK
jgi:hypothetical protein